MPNQDLPDPKATSIPSEDTDSMCPSKPPMPPLATSSKEQKPKSLNEQWSESMPIEKPFTAYRQVLEGMNIEHLKALECGTWDHPCSPIDDLKRLSALMFQETTPTDIDHRVKQVYLDLPVITEPPFKLLVRHDVSPTILKPEDLQIIKGNFENKGSFPPETWGDHPDPTLEQKTEDLLPQLQGKTLYVKDFTHPENWHVDPPMDPPSNS